MASDGLHRVALGIVLVAIVLLAGCSAAGPLGGNGAPSGDGAEFVGQSADIEASQSSGSSGGVGSFYSDDGDRVVVRTADMTLRVEEFEPAFQELRTIVDRHDGYLGDRSQKSEGEWDRGRITVRVPAAQFPEARDAIADLGRVESESVDAKDFTNEYRQRQDRIENLRDEEESFEALLDDASNASEATRIRSELQDIRQELDSMTAEQSRLEQREAFSTITVTMKEPTDRKPPANYTSDWGFTDAFLAAFFLGTMAIKVVVVFFGVIIPIGIAAIMLGIFGVVLWRLWRLIYSALRGLLEEGGGGDRSVDDDAPGDPGDIDSDG